MFKKMAKCSSYYTATFPLSEHHSSGRPVEKWDIYYTDIYWSPIKLGSKKWTSRLYIWSTRLTIHTVCANRSISVDGVAIDERDSVQKLKYPVGRQTGLCVVGGKGAGLSHRDGSKDKSSENTKYVLKRLVCYIVGGASDLVGAETEDGGIH